MHYFSKECDIMVQVKQILEKLSPDLKYGDNIMDIELGDVDFDTFNQKGYFFYVYTNSKNPDIELRIKDDFPFRVVLLKRNGNVTYGTTWNGFKKHEWKEVDGNIIDITK